LAGLYKPVKKPVTLRLDADVLAWFKKQGRGYRTRINRALLKLMMEGRKRSVTGRFLLFCLTWLASSSISKVPLRGLERASSS
jgi:hypothetical protein